MVLPGCHAILRIFESSSFPSSLPASSIHIHDIHAFSPYLQLVFPLTCPLFFSTKFRFPMFNIFTAKTQRTSLLHGCVSRFCLRSHWFLQCHVSASSSPTHLPYRFPNVTQCPWCVICFLRFSFVWALTQLQYPSSSSLFKKSRISRKSASIDRRLCVSVHNKFFFWC